MLAFILFFILFCIYYLNRHFQQTKFTSFQRQLNFYGFQRIMCSGPDQGSYYHELFLRGRSDLCSIMIRTKVVGHDMSPIGSPARKLLSGTFYDMPCCFPSRSVILSSSPIKQTVSTSHQSNQIMTNGMTDTHLTLELESSTTNEEYRYKSCMVNQDSEQSMANDFTDDFTLIEPHISSDAFHSDENRYYSDNIVDKKMDEEDFQIAVNLLLPPYDENIDRDHHMFEFHKNEEDNENEMENFYRIPSEKFSLRPSLISAHIDTSLVSPSSPATTSTPMEVDTSFTKNVKQSQRFQQMQGRTSKLYALRPLPMPPKLPFFIPEKTQKSSIDVNHSWSESE